MRATIGNPLRCALLLLVAAAIGGTAALPARADDDDYGRGRGRGHREVRHDDRYRWQQREWHDAHPNIYVAPNNYAYAPPPVVYAPPPVPPTLNFIFPLGR